MAGYPQMMPQQMPPGYGYPMMYPQPYPMMYPGMMPQQPPQQQQGGGALGTLGTLGGIYAGRSLFGSTGTPSAAAAQGGGGIRGLLGLGGAASSSLPSGAGAAGSTGIMGDIGSLAGGADAAADTMSAAEGGPGFMFGSTGAGAIPGGASWLPSLGGLAPLGIGAAAIGAGILAGRGGSEAVKGKPISPINQIGLAPLTGGLSLAQPFFARTFGSSKGKEQLARDAERKKLQDSGFIDANYGVKLANGDTFDIGKDGGDPRYNVDFNRAGAGKAVGAVQALGHYLTGGDSKLKDDFTGYLANAAMSGGDVNANAKQFISAAGLNHDTLYGAIHMDPNLDKATKDAMKNGLDELYGVGAYANKKQAASPEPTASPELLQKSGAVGYNPNRGPKPIPPQLQGKPPVGLLAPINRGRMK